MKKILIAVLLYLPFTLSALEWEWWLGGPHAISIGPEFYYLKRRNSADSHQEGWLYGAHFTYQRLRPNSIYWGLDGFITHGQLLGETGPNANTGDRSRLKSKKDDRMIEGRLGYTFRCPGDREILCALFGGWSLFEGTNKFLAPSPKEIKFNDKVWSLLMGGLLHIPIRNNVSLELRARVLRMVQGECEVTDDPLREDVTQQMGNETQTLVDLPLAYHFEGGGLHFSIEAIPFYRHWHFGGRLNLPRFFTTHYRHIGSQLLVTCSF